MQLFFEKSITNLVTDSPPNTPTFAPDLSCSNVAALKIRAYE